VHTIHQQPRSGDALSLGRGPGEWQQATRDTDEPRASGRSVGMHCRLLGRPGRFRALQRFLDYIQQHDKVWVCTRVQQPRSGDALSLGRGPGEWQQATRDTDEPRASGCLGVRGVSARCSDSSTISSSTTRCGSAPGSRSPTLVNRFNSRVRAMPSPWGEGLVSGSKLPAIRMNLIAGSLLPLTRPSPQGEGIARTRLLNRFTRMYFDY
jgi:hypothetical protein